MEPDHFGVDESDMSPSRPTHSRHNGEATSALPTRDGRPRNFYRQARVVQFIVRSCMGVTGTLSFVVVSVLFVHLISLIHLPKFATTSPTSSIAKGTVIVTTGTIPAGQPGYTPQPLPTYPVVSGGGGSGGGGFPIGSGGGGGSGSGGSQSPPTNPPLPTPTPPPPPPTNTPIAYAACDHFVHSGTARSAKISNLSDTIAATVDYGVDAQGKFCGQFRSYASVSVPSLSGTAQTYLSYSGTTQSATSHPYTSGQYGSFSSATVTTAMFPCASANTAFTLSNGQSAGLVTTSQLCP